MIDAPLRTETFLRMSELELSTAEKLQAERDGYKGAYETLELEVGNLRSENAGYKQAYNVASAALAEANVKVGNLHGEVAGLRAAYNSAAEELGYLRGYTAPVIRKEVSAELQGKPSIFFVTLPKSGTVFIGNSIKQSLGYDFTSVLVTPTFPKNVVWQSMVVDFQRGGMVSVSHLQPDYENLHALQRNGVRKAVLHYRDPRAACWSWYNFRMSRPNEDAHMSKSRNDAFMELGEAERLEMMISTFYKQAVDWLTGWIDVIEAATGFECLMISHDELLRDEDAYFRRVFDFYGIDAEPKLVKKDATTHFRKGDNEDWRRGIVGEQADRMTSMMSEDICRFYGFSR